MLNNPYANITDLGGPRVCERLPPPVGVPDLGRRETHRIRIVGADVVIEAVVEDEEGEFRS